MKTKISIITFFIILFQLPSFSQKYSTLEQYKAYYLTNSSTIDPIEGIWKLFKTTTTTSSDDFSEVDNKEFIVAIIKENGKYSEYTLKDGVYEPKQNSRIFSKITGYTCTYKSTTNNFQGTSPTFFIADNKFSFTISNMSTVFQGYTWNFTMKHSYIKIFPLESDLATNEDESKVQPGNGSGFALTSTGYIVTCYHVVKGATSIKVKGIGGSFTKSYTAKVISSDANNDLSIIKIDDASFTSLGTIPYTISSTTSDVGSSIFIMGYPLTTTMGDEIKLTDGLVSAKSGYKGDITSYQISAAAQPGNSGGPLFDKNGNIIGVVNAKYLDAENATYAIKSTYLKNLIDALPTIITLPTVNILTGKALTDQVKSIKNFVYIIEVN